MNEPTLAAATAAGPGAGRRNVAPLLTARSGALLRAGGVAWSVTAVFAAFRYPLGRLFEGFRYDSPLGYLAFVPLLAVALALQAPPRIGEVRGSDRTIVALAVAPCLAVAGVIVFVLPDRMGSLYWSNRLDLLALPLVAFCAVALVWGVPVASRKLGGVAFLALAWPAPYAGALAALSNALTGATAALAGGLTELVGLVERIEAHGDPLFRVGRGPDAFVVAVSSACSGAHSVVGFGLVGAAVAASSRGAQPRKLAWLTLGVAFAWTLNVARAAAVLGVGAIAGERAALDVLHPVGGVVALSIVAVAMFALLRRFGLEPPWARPPVDRPDLLPPPARPSLAGAALLAPVALVFSFGTTALARFEPLLGAFGEAKARAAEQAPLAPAGWTAISTEEITWGTRFFGDDSTWRRVLLHTLDRAGGDGALVTVDAIATSDARRFVTFGVVDCFEFHGYEVGDRTLEPLPHGVVAERVDYRDPAAGRRWLTLSFVWPVAGGESGGRRYERLAFVTETADAAAASVEAALRAVAADVVDQRLAEIHGPEAAA